MIKSMLICRDMHKKIVVGKVPVGRPFTRVKRDRSGDTDSPWGILFREGQQKIIVKDRE